LEGRRLSAITIQKILNDKGLGTRQERWLALERQDAEQVIESQSRAGSLHASCSTSKDAGLGESDGCGSALTEQCSAKHAEVPRRHEQHQQERLPPISSWGR
jgi:hypothetical protein